MAEQPQLAHFNQALEGKAPGMVSVVVSDIIATVRNLRGMDPTSVKYNSGTTEATIVWSHCVTCRVTESGSLVQYPLVDGNTQFSNASSGKLSASKQILKFVEMVDAYCQDHYGDAVHEYEEIY